MTEEKKQEISDAVIKDDALSHNPFVPENCQCEVCILARLVDRQRQLIAALTDQVAALKNEIAAHVRGEA